MGFVKGFSGKGSVADIESYLKNPEKTNFNLISGHNVSPDSVKDSFDITKNLYRKTGGVQYHHVVQSFHVEERVSPEKVHQLGREFAEKNFKGFEVLIVTHTNEPHLHNHFLINSVSLETGKKYHSNVTKMNSLKEFSNNQCLKEGLDLSICKHGEKAKEFVSAGEYRLRTRGEISWKDEIAKKAIYCRENSVDFKNFQENMKKQGVEVVLRGNTVTYHLGDKKCRARRLGTNYEKKGVEEIINLYSKYRWTKLSESVPAIKNLCRNDSTWEIRGKMNDVFNNFLIKNGVAPEKKVFLELVQEIREIKDRITDCKIQEQKNINKDYIDKGVVNRMKEIEQEKEKFAYRNRIPEFGKSGNNYHFVKLKEDIPYVRHLYTLDENGKIREKISNIYRETSKNNNGIVHNENFIKLIKEDEEIVNMLVKCEVKEKETMVLGLTNKLIDGFLASDRKFNYEQTQVLNNMKAKTGQNTLKKGKKQQQELEM